MSSPHSQLTRLQLGVWTVAILNDTKPALRKAFDSFVSSLSIYRRVAYDIYNAERLISVLYLLCMLWEIVAPALVLYTSNDLLACIERSLQQGKPEAARICWNLGAHVFMSGISAIESWTRDTIAQPRLEMAFRLHCEFQLMQTHLNLDVPTSLNPLTRKKIRLESLAYLVIRVVETIIAFLQVITQVGLLMYLTSNSPVLLVLSLAEPIHSVTTRRTLYNTPHVSHTENSDYQRSNSLVAMSAPTFRSKVLSSNLVSYILDEYKRSSAILLSKGLSTSDSPREMYRLRLTPLNDIASAVLRDSNIVRGGTCHGYACLLAFS
ncbi:hypothetical protein BDZ89DRAFT_987696 [Hymenopellis radicata]|nr:hypothetical protein BDZ89DRAFT_987696 [Hymenopellis radicata]